MTPVEAEPLVRRERGPRHVARREGVGRVAVALDREADLLEVVLALGVRRGVPDLADGRQQQPDEDGDDGEDDEQFHERERTADSAHGHSPRGDVNGVLGAHPYDVRGGE